MKYPNLQVNWKNSTKLCGNIGYIASVSKWHTAVNAICDGVPRLVTGSVENNRAHVQERFLNSNTDLFSECAARRDIENRLLSGEGQGIDFHYGWVR